MEAHEAVKQYIMKNSITKYVERLFYDFSHGIILKLNNLSTGLNSDVILWCYVSASRGIT